MNQEVNHDVVSSAWLYKLAGNDKCVFTLREIKDDLLVSKP